MSLHDTSRLSPPRRTGRVPPARRLRPHRAVTASRAPEGHADADEAASALVHDFNNLMTVIFAASEQLAESAPAGSGERDLALVCLQAAERGAELMERLSSRSRPQPAVAVDCARVLETTLRFARQAAPADIRLEAGGKPVACAGDAAALETAVLNLCLNAIDAMPQGGLLTLDAREAQVSPVAAERIGLAPGRYARISVSDTGFGMSAQTLARATEPYFTTKGSAGTGLGLASAAEVARCAGGALSIASQPAEGTVACLYLPLATPPRRRSR